MRLTKADLMDDLRRERAARQEAERQRDEALLKPGVPGSMWQGEKAELRNWQLRAEEAERQLANEKEHHRHWHESFLNERSYRLKVERQLAALREETKSALIGIAEEKIEPPDGLNADSFEVGYSIAVMSFQRRLLAALSPATGAGPEKEEKPHE